MKRKRILCACAGGNCRSVTLATLLKYNFRPSEGADALAVALEKNSEYTISVLLDWAEQIIVVDEETETLMKQMMADHHVAKKEVLNANIGQDKWGMSMHPALVPIAYEALVRLGFEPRQPLEDVLKRGSKYSLRRGVEDPMEGL